MSAEDMLAMLRPNRLSDSVDLKVTVPEDDRVSVVQALGARGASR
jgi:hypothetical protein